MARKYIIHRSPGKALTIDDRKILASDWNRQISEGKNPSLREFAKSHGLPYSTWRTEYNRGKTAETVGNPKNSCRRLYGTYDHIIAQETVDKSTANRGPKMKLTNLVAAEFANLVVVEKRSPYDARQIIVAKFPDKNVPCVRTFYNHINHGDIGVHYGETPYHPDRRAKRGPKPHPAKVNLAHEQLHDRPKEAGERSEPGHFEMDTVVSCLGGKGGLLVVIDRMTREYFIELLPSISQSATTKALKNMGKRGVFKNAKSMTTDNGSEFTDDAQMRDVIGCGIYYTRAYASWEKGSVENCNRMVRRWYPKGTDFSECTKSDIRKLEEFINSVHRQSLGGKTAAEYAALQKKAS